MATTYMVGPHMDTDLKRASAELLILSLLEARARHGYELCKLIETRSRGVISFNVASLYPLLYRLEDRRWITGKWVEKAGQRRRRYYKISAAGKKVLAERKSSWEAFVAAIGRVTGDENA
jgi:PadR family transcriptional regulator, regulatory protein PadR